MREDIRTRLLPIIALLFLAGTITAPPVRAAAAVLVYDYGFAKQASWTQRGHIVLSNKTSVFTQDDRFVIAYVSAALYAANLTSQWYDPTGQMVYNDTTQAECETTPCTFLFYLSVANDSATGTRFGLWRMALLADGFKLYSAYFSITPVIIEDNYWNFNVTQSAPPRVQGALTVTVIHPDNRTWSHYSRYMPYAANITAHESTTNRTLHVTTYNNSLVVVDLGGARSDGYTFVLNFDLSSGLGTLNGWYGGSFAFAWQDQPWEHVTWQRSLHPTPETFNITLPKAATFVDIGGSHVMTLDYNVTGGDRTSISFTATVPPEQSFGWTIIYRDLAFRNSHYLPSSTPYPGLNWLALSQPIPVLPLTFGALSLWTAVMSAFLLTASELLSPIYARTELLVNRRRLRIAAVILLTIFIALTAYQLVASFQPLVSR
jgi:hypothetical protein